MYILEERLYPQCDGSFRGRGGAGRLSLLISYSPSRIFHPDGRASQAWHAGDWSFGWLVKAFSTGAPLNAGSGLITANAAANTLISVAQSRWMNYLAEWGGAVDREGRWGGEGGLVDNSVGEDLNDTGSTSANVRAREYRLAFGKSIWIERAGSGMDGNAALFRR